MNEGGVSALTKENVQVVAEACGIPALECTAAALLGWGGVSVHCQTAAVLADTDLPLGRYLAAKALQAAISAPLAWAVWPLLSGGGTL